MKKLFLTLIAAAVLATPTLSMAAYEFYVTIEGTKQGKFKGESVREQYKDKIPALSFNYQVTSPRDAATGMATGKRQHRPVTLVKEWGAASPQILRAMVDNETLKTVLVEFVRTTPEGLEEIYFTIKLNNAQIASIKQATANATAVLTRAADIRNLEEVSFTFQSMEQTYKPTATTVIDNWTTTN